MRKVSKKVVKETTTTQRTKTTTTIHETECGCGNFECLQERFGNDKDFTVNEDKSITFVKEKSHERNGNKLMMKLTTVIRPIEVTDGDNIIQIEKTITEVITKEEQPKSERLDLKGILDAMAGKSRPSQSDISDMIDDMVDGIVKRRKGKNAPDSSQIAEMLQTVLGKKTGANVKVIDMTNFPSFEDFMKMMKDESK